MNNVLLIAMQKVKEFYGTHPKLTTFLFGLITGLLLAFIF